MESEQMQNIEYKIIIIGESGIGKTCILNRLINDYYEAQNTTAGPTYQNKLYEFGNVKISLNIWDTAGQEKFRSVQRIVYNNTDAAILVYDITRADSLEAIKSFWYQEVKDHCPESLGKPNIL